MIPPFEPNGKLPPGIHWATWTEIAERFGWNPHRRELLAGLRRAVDMLGAAGCTTLYLDGSFVTSRAHPNDYDACWAAHGVDVALLDRSLLEYVGNRTDQAVLFHRDLFPSHGLADPFGMRFLDFFQRDKFTRRPKGIVSIRIGVDS
jgi:hypothetical protein